MYAYDVVLFIVCMTLYKSMHMMECSNRAVITTNCAHYGEYGKRKCECLEMWTYMSRIAMEYTVLGPIIIEVLAYPTIIGIILYEYPSEGMFFMCWDTMYYYV